MVGLNFLYWLSASFIIVVIAICLFVCVCVCNCFVDVLGISVQGSYAT